MASAPKTKLGLEALLTKYQGYVAPGTYERPRTMFSIGPLSLNLAVGNYKGVPSGRIIQIVGQESSGKSTLALDILAQHQRAFPAESVGYVDFERSFVADYAAACGVDLARILVVRPDTTEQGFTILEDMIQNGIRVVVVDSVAAAKPSSENNRDYEDAMKMASSAGIITRFCNRIVPIIDNADAVIVMINQLRENFNTMSPEKTIAFGGRALRYATGVTISLVRTSKKEQRIDVQATIRKNKVGAPYQVTEFQIVYGAGIDHNTDAVQLALQRGLLTKGGAWYTYKDQKFQGEVAVAEAVGAQLRAEIVASFEGGA